MASTELNVLMELTDALRLRGVKVFHGSYDGRDVLLEFGPTEKHEEVVTVGGSVATEDPEKCHCGHFTYQHQNSLCIMGCDIDKCIDPEKT